MAKWTAGFLLLLLVALAVYAGSAFVSLERLAAAARASDGAEVIARTNIPRVRHAIISQVISAYLEKIGQKRPVRPIERMAIETFGASLADDLAIKLVTAENLSALLKSGAVKDSTAKLEFAGMPALADLNVSNVADVLGRIRFIKPVEFEIMLGADRSAGSIGMHFEGSGWKLSSVNLPAPVVAKLVERLPVR